MPLQTLQTPRLPKRLLAWKRLIPLHISFKGLSQHRPGIRNETFLWIKNKTILKTITPRISFSSISPRSLYFYEFQVPTRALVSAKWGHVWSRILFFNPIYTPKEVRKHFSEYSTMGEHGGFWRDFSKATNQVADTDRAGGGEKAHLSDQNLTTLRISTTGLGISFGKRLFLSSLPEGRGFSNTGKTWRKTK